jgi:hypothetical protein
MVSDHCLHVCPERAELELEILLMLLDCDRTRLNQQLEICKDCGQCDRRARDVLGDFFHALLLEEAEAVKHAASAASA